VDSLPRTLTLDDLNELCGSAAQAVRLATQCTRALVLAHFDDAGRKTKDGKARFVGATQASLELRLQAEIEGDWQRSWDLYRDFWARVQTGPMLVESGGTFNIRARREKSGKYEDGRPSVLTIVQGLLDELIPHGLTEDWYRSDLCKRHQIVDGPEFVEFAQKWLVRFNRIEASEASRANLIDLLSSPEQRMWGEGLVEALDSLAVLQYFSGDLLAYKLRFKADPGFVLAHLFGRSTGVPGLDYLFFGGLWNPGGVAGTENLSIAISGAPGMGKSTLALSLGAQIAARGGYSLLFRFEAETRTFVRQISHFRRAHRPFFDLRVKSSKAEPSGQQRDGGEGAPLKGLFVMSDIPTAPAESIHDVVFAEAESAPARQYRMQERVIIFDSLSASQGYGEDIPFWRTFLFEMTSLLKAMGFMVVFVLERANADDRELMFDDFLVDVDLQLSTHDPTGAYPYRTLEIAKSRLQASHRGKHVYSVTQDVGMRVFPSAAAVLSARRNRHLRARHAARHEIDPGIVDFQFLGGVSEKSFLREGSVTALIGPRGNLKTAAAEVFSRTLSSHLSHSPAALSLHFADEFQQIVAVPRSARISSLFGARYDLPLTALGKDGRASTLSYLHLRSGFLDAAHVLHAVQEIIAEKRRQQTPIKRAVVADLGNIFSCFPALREDAAFIPCLCDLFASEGITTFLVYSMRSGTDSFDPLMEQVRASAENILQFGRSIYLDREYRTIRVERSVDGTHDTRIYEITAQLTDHSYRVTILPTFDRLVGVREGVPRPIRVKVLLTAETDLQRVHQEHHLRQIAALSGFDIQVDNTWGAPVQGSKPYDAAPSGSDVGILQYDSRDLMRYAFPDGGRLADLTAGVPELAERVRELIPARIVLPNGRYAPSSALLTTLPYFLNPSFLVTTEPFYSTLKRALGPKLTAGTYSWSELIAAVEGSAPGTPILGGAVFRSEDLNCLFLEILAAELGDVERIHQWRKEGSELAAAAAQSILHLRRLLGGRLQGFPAASLAPAAVEPVYSRHWYTSYRQAAASRAGGDPFRDAGFKFLLLPGRVWTCGDWHIGVLRGSHTQRVGPRILLDYFVGRAHAHERLAAGAGLPPYPEFYDDETPYAGLRSTWFKPYISGENVIYRSAIPGYSEAASALSYRIAAAISGSDERPLRDQMESYLGMLKAASITTESR
jgi:KaiC/GvpD/RAD55 family RecA-like ATPase